MHTPPETLHTAQPSANSRRRSILAAALVACTGASQAQPGGGIARIVVPFAAGGARDMPARVIQHELGKELGLNLIIENKSGAGGAIGTAYVAHAAPDGKTLLMAASSHFVTAELGPRPFYEPVKEFAPAVLIGKQSYVLLVQAALPVRNLAELVAYAKSQPGVLNYTSAGVASSTHLAAAYFASLGGIQIVHIPFKGTQEAANDVVGGRAHLVFVPTAGAGVYLSDRRVRVIGTTGSKRSLLLPNVPTIAESGLPSFQFESWFGLLAPVATPPAVITKLNAAANKVLVTKEVRERLQNFGIEPNPMSVVEFKKVFLADRELIAKVVRDSGITRE